MSRGKWRSFRRIFNEGAGGDSSLAPSGDAGDAGNNTNSLGTSASQRMPLNGDTRLDLAAWKESIGGLFLPSAEEKPRRGFEWNMDTVLAPMSWLLFLFAGVFYNLVLLPKLLPAIGGGAISGALCFLTFDSALVLALWSYAMAFRTDPGKLPPRWVEFTESCAPGLYVQAPMRAWQPGVATWCAACSHVRPERTHHCDTCDRCVLRMDHHCPFLMNCVGFGNHKYFLLLLLYTVLACTVGLLTTLPELLHFGGALLRLALSGEALPDLREFSASAVSVSDATMLVLFDAVALITVFIFSPMLLLCSHLAMCNETHIETLYENSAGNPYDLRDRTQNAAQLLGGPGYEWLLPLPVRHSLLGDDDGCSFPRNDLALPSDYDSLERLWSVRYNVMQLDSARQKEVSSSSMNCFGPPCAFNACRA